MLGFDSHGRYRLKQFLVYRLVWWIQPGLFRKVKKIIQGVTEALLSSKGLKYQVDGPLCGPHMYHVHAYTKRRSNKVVICPTTFFKLNSYCFGGAKTVPTRELVMFRNWLHAIANLNDDIKIKHLKTYARLKPLKAIMNSRNYERYYCDHLHDTILFGWYKHAMHWGNLTLKSEQTTCT